MSNEKLEMRNGQQGGDISEITREELLNASHASATTLQQLEKRGMLETYEVEVGRLNHGGAYHPELIKRLNTAQQEAYKPGPAVDDEETRHPLAWRDEQR